MYYKLDANIYGDSELWGNVEPNLLTLTWPTNPSMSYHNYILDKVYALCMRSINNVL